MTKSTRSVMHLWHSTACRNGSEQIMARRSAPSVVWGSVGCQSKWMQLGIIHERIEPGRPTQNGRHERMHRTLKEDAATPPAQNLKAQKQRYMEFTKVFNHERLISLI